jgi:hypothetical protein
MQRLYLKKLNNAEIKEKYQVKTPNGFIGLKNMDYHVDMNSAWPNVVENIRISANQCRSNMVKVGMVNCLRFQQYFE